MGDSATPQGDIQKHKEKIRRGASAAHVEDEEGDGVSPAVALEVVISSEVFRGKLPGNFSDAVSSVLIGFFVSGSNH